MPSGNSTTATSADTYACRIACYVFKGSLGKFKAGVETACDCRNPCLGSRWLCVRLVGLRLHSRNKMDALSAHSLYLCLKCPLVHKEYTVPAIK